MSELESILNYLETTSMEPHDDYTSEFSYKEQKVLWKYIKQLQQENKEYKEVIDKAIEYINEYAWKEDIIGDIYTVTGKPMVDKYMQLEWDNCKELLGILSEVE